MLPDKIQEHLDIENIYYEKDFFIPKHLKEYYSDLLTSVPTKGGTSEAKAYFLLEHKSTFKKYTPLQFLRSILDANMAEKLAKRLNKLLTDILDLSRIEAEKVEIRAEEFNFKEVLQSIKDIFTQVSKQNNNDLNIIQAETISERMIGDSTRLTQILFNLVGNACKYTHQGEVNFEIHLLPFDSPDSCRGLFIVSDTGKGIPDDKLDQVFEIFTQVNASRFSYSRQYVCSRICSSQST